jgi:hypothetical protein
MSVKQISVFLENKEGRLWEACDTLGKAGVNIRALSVADTEDFGIARMIVDNPERALDSLKKGGFTVGEVDVVAVEVPDKPGGLANVLEILKDAGLNVEYLYCFVDTERKEAVDVMKVEEVKKAEGVLKEKGIKLLQSEEVYNI